MVQAYLKQLEDFLNKDNQFYSEPLQNFEKKTGLKRLHLALVLIGFFCLWLIFGYGGDVICNFIGFAYPAYKSVLAIESTQTDDDTQWLTYWVVFSSFWFVELFTDLVLSWFPFYFLFKLIFLAWCMAPFSWNGASFIYHKFIRQFVLQHQSKIDAGLSSAFTAADELRSQVQSAAQDAANEAIAQKVNEQVSAALGSDTKKDN